MRTLSKRCRKDHQSLDWTRVRGRVGDKYQFKEGTAVPFHRRANRGPGESEHSHGLVSSGLEQGLLPPSLFHSFSPSEVLSGSFCISEVTGISLLGRSKSPTVLGSCPKLGWDCGSTRASGVKRVKQWGSLGAGIFPGWPAPAQARTCICL